MKSVTTKFKSGWLHEKRVVATWNLGNHSPVPYLMTIYSVVLECETTVFQKFWCWSIAEGTWKCPDVSKWPNWFTSKGLTQRNYTSSHPRRPEYCFVVVMGVRTDGQNGFNRRSAGMPTHLKNKCRRTSAIHNHVFRGIQTEWFARKTYWYTTSACFCRRWNGK